jgi:energy coupling factor transporter S component ThiW
MKENNTKKIAITAMMAAIAVVGSTFSFPIFGSKCAPVQHMVNVLCAVFLGPWYGLAAAFVASVIRNLLGLGTLLAFPGSMCGALLSGLLYRKFQTLPAAYLGEVFGTAVIGGILAFPVARLVMGNAGAALFTFVVPFLVSTAGGTVIAAVLTGIMKGTGVMAALKTQLAE